MITAVENNGKEIVLLCPHALLNDGDAGIDVGPTFAGEPLSGFWDLRLEQLQEVALLAPDDGVVMLILPV